MNSIANIGTPGRKTLQEKLIFHNDGLIIEMLGRSSSMLKSVMQMR